MFKLVDFGIIVLSSGFLLLCYMLFLRKEKYHQLNRFYLLFSLVFSSLLPFIKFSVPVQPLIPNTQSFLTTVTEAPAIPFGMVLYVVGAALFFILFLLRLFKVLKQIIGKRYIELNGLKVMDNPEQKVPFSFFHYVVVDSTTFELGELDLVLRHEAAHAKQWHTLDILFVEILGVICWFNPFVWAYKSALKSQHEYAADAAVIHSNVPRNDYFDLILKQIRHQNRLAPVHSFSATAVKSRIRIMMATVHGHHRWMRYLSVIPVSALLVVGNSLLASSKNVPSFMENAVVPAAVSQSLSEYSDKAETVPTENVKAKRAVRQTKTHTQHTDEVSHPNVLESQPWLSTQYGDPVEFYDKAADIKQEEHYNVVVTGDVPQIYQVSVTETP
jgi:hypothetical protein